MKILIGSTGLIGKTISEKITFGLAYNSKNMGSYSQEVQNENDLYLACLPATKWLVNQDPQKDMKNILQILDTLKTRTYKNVVLFSTIDVYNGSPSGVEETYEPEITKLDYGSNRYQFEIKVREQLKFDRLSIFRLPALYGKHIKKNVLFDLLNNNNVDEINTNSAYQWYGLENLVRDVQIYSETYPTESVFNLFPEPIETKEIVKLFPEYVIPEQTKRIEYNYKTKFGGYIQSKEDSLRQIQEFVSASRSN